MPSPGMRVSDAERARVVERLTEAVGEGRLTLADFDDRVGAVLAAVTDTDLERHTADLPAVAQRPVLRLRSRASSLKRTGRWVVPREVVVETRASSVRLDLTQAVVSSATVDVSLEVRSSSVLFVLPPGASASLDEVELSASTAGAKVPDTGGLHVRLHGQLQSSSLTVRYQRRFLRWRW